MNTEREHIHTKHSTNTANSIMYDFRTPSLLLQSNLCDLSGDHISHLKEAEQSTRSGLEYLFLVLIEFVVRL